MTETIAKQLKSLPQSPGVYFFKDAKGKILYIGKANALKSRVRSYFSKSNDLSAFKQIMAKKIASLETILVSNEQEALILESIMVKKHKPRFNVSLKDDKSYNFIKIDYRYPRPVVTTARRPEFDAGRSRAKYFGPYTSGGTLHENLRILRRIFPYRKKPKDPTVFEQELTKKRSLGPIPQTDEEYCGMISRLIRVLSGNTDEVLRDLKARMRTLSENRQYETAASVRDQIKNLELIQSRQKIMSINGGSQDVISIYKKDDQASVNVFVIRAGKLINKLNFLLQHTSGETMTSLCDAFLTQYYSEASNLPREIVIPARTSLTVHDLSVIASGTIISRHPELDSGSSSQLKEQMLKQVQHDEVRRITITVPLHGKKRQLIKLGEENAKEYLAQSRASWPARNASASVAGGERATEDALRGLKDALNLDDVPRRIEGYDISNIQGQLSVGSMVVFVDNKPDTSQYRKFKIKTVKGADDVASLAEVLKRRFSSSKENKWPNPDLVLLDGGKGQLSTVLKVLYNSPPFKGGVRGGFEGHHAKTSVPLPVSLKPSPSPSLEGRGITPRRFIALAKKQEEVFQGRELKKINLDPMSDASRLLQRIRDEAHRFAQKYYHTRHAKAETQSVLDEVPGIGPKTKKLLIQSFGSASGIRNADKDAIIKLIGEAKTKTLLENL